ncbi:MAG: YceH family protein [Bacteroidia bacterium]
MESPKPLVSLDPVEVRVLGCLLEKSKTTPEYYPLTLNALTLACNQKSSRKPIVQYEEGTVTNALNSLTRKGLVNTASGGGSRVLKYKHNLDIVFDFTPAEEAVLCLLFLRGPLTPGEINSNSARLYAFHSLEEVLNVLEKLKQAEVPMVDQLPRQAGQKEQRVRHLFGTWVEVEEGQGREEERQQQEAALLSETLVKAGAQGLETRLELVENELAALKDTVEKLLKELNG